MKKPWKIFLQSAGIASLSLLTVYFLLLYAVTKDIRHPLDQIQKLQPWMV